MEKTRKLSIEHVPPPVVNYGIEEYFRMVEIINTAQGFISSSYSNPSINATNYGQQKIFFGFSLFMNYQEDVQYSYSRVYILLCLYIKLYSFVAIFNVSHNNIYSYIPQ